MKCKILRFQEQGDVNIVNKFMEDKDIDSVKTFSNEHVFIYYNEGEESD